MADSDENSQMEADVGEDNKKSEIVEKSPADGNSKRKADEDETEQRETKRAKSTSEEGTDLSVASADEKLREKKETLASDVEDKNEKDESRDSESTKKMPVELKVPTIKPASRATETDSNVLNLSKKTAVPAPKVKSKDNEMADAPIDLSKGGKSTSRSPDVIMLSDEEDDLPRLVNGFKNYSPEDVAKTKLAIRKLQEELRNEESKLVLLKKIRQSQMAIPNQLSKAPSSHQGQHHSQQQSRSAGQQPSMAHSHPKQTSGISSQMHRQQQAHMHNRGQLNHSQQQQQQMALAQQKQQLQQQHQMSRSGRDVSNSANYRQAASQPPPKPAPPPQPEQSPAQRQAAAKLALRKQLEKTLLQIPPPKPPPPEMNFLPSASSGDFVPLVGLEEVVKFIVETDARSKSGKGPEVKYVFNPFTCVQCGTDFTPVWKRDKPGSKNVICEQCVTNNQKKALKQEHTNRLKSAFVKALQQEQEIEQRMLQAEKQQQQRAAAARSASPAHPPANHSSSSQSSHHHSSQPSPAHSNPTSSQSSSSRSNSDRAHSTSASSSSAQSNSAMNLASQYSKATAEQIRQHQSLLQAHQAQLRALGLSGLQNLQNFPHLAFPFQPQLSAKQAADLQRQYLLDMIQPRSLPGGGASNLWRK